MKKNKAYGPRRGMRLTGGRRGGPAGGFIGGGPLRRSRSNAAQPDDDDSTIKVTGGVMQFSQLPLGAYEPFSPVVLSSSLSLQGAVSTGRLYERLKLNATLISAPTNLQGGLLPGTSAWPSVSVMEVYDGVPGNPTGTVAGSPSRRVAPPSWTRAYMGESQAFVIPMLSSSNVENRFYNTFTSGVEGVEFLAAVSGAAGAAAFLNMAPVIGPQLGTIRYKFTGSFANNFTVRLIPNTNINDIAGHLSEGPLFMQFTYRDGVTTIGQLEAALTGVLTGSAFVTVATASAAPATVLTSSLYDPFGWGFQGGYDGATEVQAGLTATLRAPTYYSKETRLRTVMVKKTASFFDTVPRSGSWVPQSFVAASGCLFSVVTGVAENSLVPSEGSSKQSSAWAPASIIVPVTASGRILDVKVWVELIQGSSSNDPFPLGNLGLAVRSPNLTWGNAHPIRNDPSLVRVYTSPGDTFSWLGGIHEGFRRMYAGTGSNVNRFYRDTFILWEGPAIFDAGAICNMPTVNAIDGGQFGQHFAVWQKDRGMRTVFCDGAAVPNPRHLFGSPSGNFLGSPNAGVGRSSGFGADVPWTSEANIRGSQQFALAGSPPAGWLTAAGGKNDVNEWATTGVNYGTNSIRPLYPLLDTVFCKKRVTNEALPASGTTNSTIPESYRPDLWAGFRPGLRGTEVSGNWEILLVAGGSFIDDPVPNWYFRQVRLEFILESPTYTRPSRFTQRRQPIKSSGAPRIIQTISGSDAVLYPPLLAAAVAGWDYWLTDIYASFDSAGEVGRSFGVRLKTGSVPPDTALTYRLTGALADIVGNTPSWLLGGPGGMPIIPESSASLVPFVAQPIVSISPASFLEPRRLLDLPQRLQDIAADQNPVQSLRQLATRFAATSST